MVERVVFYSEKLSGLHLALALAQNSINGLQRKRAKFTAGATVERVRRNKAIEKFHGG